MYTVAVSSLKAVSVQQSQEKLEILLLPIVGGRRHQEEMPRELSKHLPESISLRVLDFIAVERCGHFVGLVTNNEVPVGVRQLCLHIFVAAQFIEAANGQRIFSEPVSSARRFKFVVCENLEWKLKPLKKFVLPLLGEIARTHDQTSVQVTTNEQFLDEQTCHDRLPGARIIGEQKP